MAEIRKTGNSSRLEYTWAYFFPWPKLEWRIFRADTVSVLLNYPQNVRCMTLHMSQYRKIIHRQVAMLLYISIIKHCQIVIGIYKRLVHSKPHCMHVHVHTLYLMWRTDGMTLQFFHFTKVEQQVYEDINWNTPQSKMLYTFLITCRHWVWK